MAAYERVTLNRGGRNSRFDCNWSYLYATLRTIKLTYLRTIYVQINDDN